MGFQQCTDERFVSDEKYTSLPHTQQYAIVCDWDFVSVLISGPHEKWVLIEGPDWLSLFFTIQTFLSNRRAVWMFSNGIQALTNAGAMTYRMERAMIHVLKMTTLVQQAIVIHVCNDHFRLREKNDTLDHHGTFKNGGIIRVWSRMQG